MERLYAIGDIHGCYDEMHELLLLIEEDANLQPTKIVFLGDYVDRGPDSAMVIDYLIRYKERARPNLKLIFLKGNHEDMLMKACFGKPTLQDEDMFYYNGGYATKLSYEKENLIFKDHEEFYNSLERYHRHGDFFFVHAGLNPTASTFPQDLDRNVKYYEYDPLIWDRAWNNYDGVYHDNLFVVHGHTPVQEIHYLPNQINIDTGCVFGKEHSDKYGQLTGVRLDGRTKEEIKVFQVRKKFNGRFNEEPSCTNFFN